MSEAPSKYASRGGDKLAAALDAFDIDVSGLVCADFGCNAGGFTDCLLQHGAEKVFAVDTGYGALAWPLRKNPRVVVMERTNALYCDVSRKVDLVTIDVAWTPQALIVPAAMRWLAATDTGAAAAGGEKRIISLLKPHYEMAKLVRSPKRRTITPSQARELCMEVCGRLAEIGCTVRAVMRSPLLGKGGNQEFLLEVCPPVLAEGRGWT